MFVSRCSIYLRLNLQIDIVLNRKERNFLSYFFTIPDFDLYLLKIHAGRVLTCALMPRSTNIGIKVDGRAGAIALRNTE